MYWALGAMTVLNLLIVGVAWVDFRSGV